MKQAFKLSVLAAAAMAFSGVLQAQSSNINVGPSGTITANNSNDQQSGEVRITAPGGLLINPAAPTSTVTTVAGNQDPGMPNAFDADGDGTDADGNGIPDFSYVYRLTVDNDQTISTAVTQTGGQTQFGANGSILLTRGSSQTTITTSTIDTARRVRVDENGNFVDETVVQGTYVPGNNNNASFIEGGPTLAIDARPPEVAGSGADLRMNGNLVVGVAGCSDPARATTCGDLLVNGNTTLLGTTATNGIINTGALATGSLQTVGDAAVGGNLGVAGTTSTNGIANAGSISTATLATSGNAVVGGALNVAGASNTNGIANTGNLNNSGSVNTATLVTTSNAAVGGALSVVGATATNGIANTGAISTTTLATTGAASVGGPLSVTGASALNGLSNTGEFLNTGNAVINGTLQVGAVGTTESTETFDGDVGMALLPALSNNADGTSTVYTVLNRNASTRTVTSNVSGGTASFGTDGTLVLSGGGSSTSTSVQTFDVARRVVVDNTTGNVISVDPDPIQGVYSVGPDGVPMFVEGLPDAVVTLEENAGQGGNLDMAGDAAIGGTLRVAGATATNGISNTGDFTNSGAVNTATLATTGAATVGGALSVAGATSTNGISNTGNIVNSGAVNTATLVTTGDAQIGGGLRIVGSTLTNGNAQIDGGLRVIGNSDTDGNASVGGALRVVGATSTNGITNTGNIVNSGAVNTATLATTGAASIGGALTVAGPTTTNGLLTAAGGLAVASSGNQLAVNSSGVAASAGNASALSLNGSGASLSGNGASVALNGNSASLSNSTGHGIFVSATETVISGGTNSTNVTFNDTEVVFDRDGSGPARVTGIADGSRPFDAVNYRQLEKTRKELAAGLASVAAIANIPQVEHGKRFSFGAGVGSHDSESGYAIGFSARLWGTAVMKASYGGSSDGEATYGLGVAASW